MLLSLNNFKQYFSSYLTVSFQEAKIIYRIGTKIAEAEKRRVINFGNKKTYKRCVSKKKSYLKYVALEDGKENCLLKKWLM